MPRAMEKNQAGEELGNAQGCISVGVSVCVCVGGEIRRQLGWVLKYVGSL